MWSWRSRCFCLGWIEGEGRLEEFLYESGIIPEFDRASVEGVAGVAGVVGVSGEIMGVCDWLELKWVL